MNINIFTSLGIILFYICCTTIGRYLLVGLQDEDNKQVTDGEMAGRYGGKLSLELSKALEQWIKKNNGTHPLKNWIPFNPNH